MAEALVAIGLTSAICQFLDFGGRVVRQLRRLETDMADSPQIFRGIRTRLPLMLDLVRKIMLQVDAGTVSDSSLELMLPIVHNCVSQAEQLDKLISRALPQAKDSSWARGKKAVYGVIAESEIEKFDLALKANFDLLMQAGTFRSFNKTEQNKPVELVPTFNLSPNINITVPYRNMYGTSPPPQYNGNKSMLNHEGQRHGSLPELERQLSHPSSPVFLIPFQRDANFLGRQSTLETIEKKFQTQNCVAVSGLGGIGKSQIAIEYCYLFKEKNPDAHVFWIYGANPAHFERGYQDIARKLRIPGWDDEQVDVLKLVHEWFNEENNNRWLLVIDNADDGSMYFPDRKGGVQENAKSFARYIPCHAKGFTMITTRDRRVGERLSGRNKAVEVELMTEAESIELLRSKVCEEEEWNEDDAKRLVKALSYLPLAISQAAAFISENCLTVSEYLETLFAGEEDLKELLSEHLEDPRRDIDSENSVIRTWKLSFDQISKETPRAAEILSLLAALDYHGAPVILVRRENETETSFRTALGALQAFSLITVGRGKDAIAKMHRLVAIATQRWLEQHGTLEDFKGQAAKVLTDKFPGPYCQAFSTWPLMEALVPHNQLIFSFPFTKDEDLLQVAKLSVAAALFDLSRGRYEEAHQKCLKSIEIREKILGEEDKLTIESVQTLGETLLHRCELREAKKVLERAVAGREKVLGPLDPETLESYSDLTITLLELDELDAAEITARKAFEGRQEVLGEGDADTLVSLNVMAMARQRQGDLAGAKEMCEKAAKEREKLLGPEHPDTLMTLNNLARLHYEQRNLEAARELFQRVIDGEKKVLGAEGYDIQVTMTNMALVLEALADVNGAEALLKRVLDIRERLLGRDHPSTLFAVENLADLMKRSDQPTASEKLYARIERAKSGKQRKEEAGALLRAGLLFD